MRARERETESKRERARERETAGPTGAGDEGIAVAGVAVDDGEAAAGGLEGRDGRLGLHPPRPAAPQLLMYII